MAITKAFDNAEKKQYENELFRVFKDIENNLSTILCKELVERFQVDKNSSMKPYIDNLYQNYPNQIAEITARVTAPHPSN